MYESDDSRYFVSKIAYFVKYGENTFKNDLFWQNYTDLNYDINQSNPCARNFKRLNNAGYTKHNKTFVILFYMKIYYECLLWQNKYP